MAKQKLTQATVDALRPKAKHYALGDQQQAGLQVRVLTTGRVVYQIRHRPVPGGPEKLTTIGAHPEMKLRDAREKATQILAEAIKERPKLKRDAKLDVLWSEALDLAEKHHFSTMKSGTEVLRVLRNEFAEWNGRRVRSITPDDVGLILNQIHDRPAPVYRNRVAAYLRSLFRFLGERHHVVTNPAAGFRKIVKAERKGDRVLTDEELVLVLRAATAADERAATKFNRTPRPPVWRDLFELLVLTGCRRGEVGDAMASEVDMKAGVWRIPSARMKAGVEHVVPLSVHIKAILARRLTLGEERLFSTGAGRAISGWSKIKAILDAEIATLNDGKPIPAWNVHDLRRTVRTGLTRLGVDRDVAERVLAHSIQGVEGIYNRHDYVEEVSAALTKWGEHVDKLAAVSVPSGKGERFDRLTRRAVLQGAARR